MKTKLLKIIRKRYQIIYYPKGIPLESNGECMVLYDYHMDAEWTNQRVAFLEINVHVSVKEAYNKLYKKLEEKIYENYKKHGTRRLNRQNRYVLWYINRKKL